MRFNRQPSTTKSTFVQPSPPTQGPRPYKTGYEAYKNFTYVPEMQVDASVWGTGAPTPSKYGGQQTQQSASGLGPQQTTTASGSGKKMMSLEEVEAAMRAQPKKPTALPQHQAQAQAPPSDDRVTQAERLPAQQPLSFQGQDLPPQRSSTDYSYTDQPQVRIQQRPAQQTVQHGSRSSQMLQTETPHHGSSSAQNFQPPAPPQILQRNQPPPQQVFVNRENQQPRQILQNPNRHSGQFNGEPPEPPVAASTQYRGSLPGQNGSNVQLPIIYHPSQIMNLTEEERNAYLVEEAKRAKRNHKIFMLSKGNGLMTPQDKNFITRIQLQQLMTATGNVNDQDPDASLSEDFYYQVYNQIENRPRQNPHQPLSNFAQTYLFRTGGRQGGLGRRQRGGDSHMQRMEQQVHRAVEAAKAKPKNKQLVIEGSLGKISFSNAKTPKPLLNIRRQDSSDVVNRPTSRKAQEAGLSTTDRKAVLKNIEAVYTTLMKMEDHDRHMTAPPAEPDPAVVQAIQDWQQTFQELNQQLWLELKVTAPIVPDSAILHPFIAFLSYPKGKKAIPRIFNHIDDNQRLTILTMIILHLDILDVVRLAQAGRNTVQPSSTAREQIDLFLQAVMPSLFSYVAEAPLNIVIGLLGLVVERVNLHAIVRTRVGLEVLTMFLSRAAIIKAVEAPDDQTWDQWLGLYNQLFDLVEPLLSETFPTSANAGQDQYVWQFLAANGSGANPEQQQRLVLAVK